MTAQEMGGNYRTTLLAADSADLTSHLEAIADSDVVLEHVVHTGMSDGSEEFDAAVKAHVQAVEAVTDYRSDPWGLESKPGPDSLVVQLTAEAGARKALLDGGAVVELVFARQESGEVAALSVYYSALKAARGLRDVTVAK